MDFVNGLIEKVKPELNHIYTEKPFVTAGGGDFGWFCREHALHLYGVATLLGKNAEICVGDVLLRRPQGDSFYSIGATSGHAWCCIDELAPVDVSLTIGHQDHTVHRGKDHSRGKRAAFSRSQKGYVRWEAFVAIKRRYPLQRPKLSLPYTRLKQYAVL